MPVNSLSRLRGILGHERLGLNLRETRDGMGRKNLLAYCSEDPTVMLTLQRLIDFAKGVCPKDDNLCKSDPELGDAKWAMSNYDKQTDTVKQAVNAFVHAFTSCKGFHKLKTHGRRAASIFGAFGMETGTSTEETKEKFSEPMPGQAGQAYNGQPTPSDTFIRHETQKGGVAKPLSNLEIDPCKGMLQPSDAHPDVYAMNESLPPVVSIQQANTDISAAKPTDVENLTTSEGKTTPAQDTTQLITNPVQEITGEEKRNLKKRKRVPDVTSSANMGVKTMPQTSIPPSSSFGAPAQKLFKPDKWQQMAGMKMLIDNLQNGMLGTQTIATNAASKVMLNPTTYQQTKQGSGGMSGMGAGPGTNTTPTAAGAVTFTPASMQQSSSAIIPPNSGSGAPVVTVTQQNQPNQVNQNQQNTVAATAGAAASSSTVSPSTSVSPASTVNQQTAQPSKATTSTTSSSSLQGPGSTGAGTVNQGILAGASTVVASNVASAVVNAAGSTTKDITDQLGVTGAGSTQNPQQQGPALTTAATTTSTTTTHHLKGRRTKKSVADAAAAAAAAKAATSSTTTTTSTPAAAVAPATSTASSTTTSSSPVISGHAKAGGSYVNWKKPLGKLWANTHNTYSDVFGNNWMQQIHDMGSEAANKVNTLAGIINSMNTAYPKSTQFDNAVQAYKEAVAALKRMSNDTMYVNQPLGTSGLRGFDISAQQDMTILSVKLADLLQSLEMHYLEHGTNTDFAGNLGMRGNHFFDLIYATRELAGLPMLGHDARDALTNEANNFAISDDSLTLGHTDALKNRRDAGLQEVGRTQHLFSHPNDKLPFGATKDSAGQIQDVAGDIPSQNQSASRKLQGLGLAGSVGAAMAYAAPYLGFGSALYGVSQLAQPLNATPSPAPAAGTPSSTTVTPTSQVSGAPGAIEERDTQYETPWSRAVEDPVPFLRMALKEGGAEEVSKINDDPELKAINRLTWQLFNNYSWDANEEVDNPLHMTNVIEEARRFQPPNDEEELIPGRGIEAIQETYDNDFSTAYTLPEQVQLDSAGQIEMDIIPWKDVQTPEEVDLTMHNVFLPAWFFVPRSSGFQKFTQTEGTQLPDSYIENPNRITGNDWPGVIPENRFIETTLE